MSPFERLFFRRILTAWAASLTWFAVVSEVSAAPAPAAPTPASAAARKASAPPAPARPSKLDARSAFALAEVVAAQVKGGRVMGVSPNGSMRPLFEENAYLVLEPTQLDRVSVGDIVTYESASLRTIVVQRVLDKEVAAFRAGGAMMTPGSPLMRVFAIIYVREGDVLMAAAAGSPDPKKATVNGVVAAADVH